MNTKQKGFRIYSWARFIIFLTILILIAFMAGGLVFKTTVSGMEEIQYDSVVVMHGDTLWDIADQYCNGMDIRNYIHEVCKINNISAGNIYPGQVLEIPIR